MKLGYLAIDQYGQADRLLSPKAPRKQLLDKLGRKHCAKMYCDRESGPPVHSGYIVAGRWFTLYEVHSWQVKLS